MSQYPTIFLFLNKADEETFPEAVSEIEERREKYRRIMTALKERADITRFAPGVDYKKLGDILDFTIDGLLLRSVKNGNVRSDLFLEEAEEYIDMVKHMAIQGDE